MRAWLLFPFSLVFCALVSLRRLAYSQGWLASWRSPVPVVVVGNITAGGAGKTPLVVALAEHLGSRQIRAGIVVRGYGGSGDGVTGVSCTSSAEQVGDEALLLARRTGVPVVAGANRPAAVQRLIRDTSVDVVLSDDGLQHYALQRDIEIAVIDRVTGTGNGFPLPAGPLRESVKRLQEVDMVICSGGDAQKIHNDGRFGYQLKIDDFVNVRDSQRTISLSQLRRTPVHAVAAIAYPQKFFNSLRRAGLTILEHEFPDHHPFCAEDLQFDTDCPIVMTEKDMVKCERWAKHNVWYAKVSANVDDAFFARFDNLLGRYSMRAIDGC